ncbi:hypothetical protein OG948_46560 (plasmid) [Embleya sp. NBC_00888]|uniref:hypothetical protein n=1 Tax=Embleya sp. NBC_00888 TaxID=2975960 RepID=UPI00386D8570|nr:hypothetical protein OG948_46560 [Embleya sp. NBC_00888]
MTTRLCLDSRMSTGLLFGLRRTGVARAVERPGVRGALTATLRRVHLGGDGFAVRVDAIRGAPGRADGDAVPTERRVTYAVTGRGQSRATGLVAAHATRHILTGAARPGVRHLDEVDELLGLPESLGSEGLRLRRFRHDAIGPIPPAW